jgi:aconitate hydratase
VNLLGELRPWVSAKDIILELLRRLTVKGGLGSLIEYGGSGLAHLTVWDRETICNMTQELGATTAVFPSDHQTRAFLRAQRRERDWRPIQPESHAQYDEVIDIDLGALEPLVATPSSPDNVVPVRELAGTALRQVAVGSSVNSSYRDIMAVGLILKDRRVHPNIHMTLSPGSRQILLNVMKTGVMSDLMRSGVRALEIACGPCIGMGAAPPSRGNSLRSFNRNFPGRSGTSDDQVFLASPETCAASALTGMITDPRTLGDPIRVSEPSFYEIYEDGFIRSDADSASVALYASPNIIPPPPVPALPKVVRGEVLLALADHVSTDTILPSGNQVLPLRSNIPALSEMAFVNLDPTFATRARQARSGIVVAGQNFGQGSSREHAAIVMMHLGVRAVIAEDYARIHESNLINFGILPLRFRNPADRHGIQVGDIISLVNHKRALASEDVPIVARVLGRDHRFEVGFALSPRQREILLAGGLAAYFRSTRSVMRGSQANLSAV